MKKTEPEIPMSPEKFASTMKAIIAEGDPEGGHIRCDKLMADVLRALGYGEGIDHYEAVSWWYA